MKYTKRGSGPLSLRRETHARRRATLHVPQESKGDEMRNIYYNHMRIAALRIPCAATSLSLLAAFAGAQQAPLRTASLESHEGLTITATPWTDAAKYKDKFPKKSPFVAGILAVEVSFRNDSDESVRVTLSRIRLTVHVDAENTQELPSLSAEELVQAVLKPGGKDPTAKRNKIPLPVPIPKGGGGKNAEELQRQAQEAGVPTGVVAPHSTVKGLLYFDLQSQFDLLETAHLYVPELVLMRGNRALTYFDIDLGH